MEKDISRRWNAVYILTCLLIFGVFSIYDQSSRGAVAAFSFAAVALAAKTRWDLKEKNWFIVFIAGVSLIHLLAVIFIDWEITIKPTILLAPIIILDFIAILASIYLIENILD